MEHNKRYIGIGISMIVLISLAGLLASKSLAAGGSYKILAWNDLGMHCYNQDFADLAVLPPYNTLWVQVVKVGDPPEIVTSGITVEYYYQDNTYSVGKTNFWSYDQDLFGVDLPLNVGLKGKGLSGTMDLSGDHFIAEGIPITEFSDSAPSERQPYQLATVVVKDSTTGEILASNQVVTPTSSEMRCDNCHSDTGIAKPEQPTGKVETNILQLHDEEAGTTLMANRPVLCANCHASNALGMGGKPGIPNLSKAMHEEHASVIPSTLDGCYNCHPGPQTRCLRDVMSVKFGMSCVSCHGGMAAVANNPNPWLKEPRCDACHNTGQYHQDQVLYRFSKEHGGLYCEACHDSTHAVAPSRETNDRIKFNQLQGNNGPIAECSVCHATTPDSGGPHSTTAVYFASMGINDGWILESSETSGAGGSLSKTATILRLGDDAANKQYRSILSFDTSSLPDNAVITSVTLKFKYAGVTGTNPFKTHGSLIADVRKPAFSNNVTLQLSDFNASSSRARVLNYINSLADNWYSQSFNPVDFTYINPLGVTQFRLRFSKDDNNDHGTDYLKIYSGDALLDTDRPLLIVDYYLP